jgi:hypothetical protein
MKTIISGFALALALAGCGPSGGDTAQPDLCSPAPFKIGDTCGNGCDAPAPSGCMCLSHKWQCMSSPIDMAHPD